MVCIIVCVPGNVAFELVLFGRLVGWLVGCLCVCVVRGGGSVCWGGVGRECVWGGECGGEVR